MTPECRCTLRKGMEKAASRTHDSMLEKVAEFNSETGSWTLRDMPPGMFHVHGVNTLLEPGDDWIKLGNWQALIKGMFPQYVKTLSHDRRTLLKHFTAQDLAFKVVGGGSVGTRCLVLLIDRRTWETHVPPDQGGTAIGDRAVLRCRTAGPCGRTRRTRPAGDADSQRHLPWLGDRTIGTPFLFPAPAGHEAVREH